MFSTLGTVFKVTTFAESHCAGVGALVDGCPPRLPLTEADIQPRGRIGSARSEGQRNAQAGSSAAGG